ncbi:MAG: hypothetical protein PVH29_13280 [Candidatus Zixiibacteriota bacterium]|jgi:hypothetical protein
MIKQILRYCSCVVLFIAAFLPASCEDEEERELYGGPWRIVKTPAGIEASVGEIQFLSKNDGWAIAGKYLLRFNGKEWYGYKKIVHPDPLSDYGFADFQMLNENEGWFVGKEIVPDPRGGGRKIQHSMIWHFDGETFTPVEHPEMGWLGTVWFNDSGDGWALGYGALHYVNGTWENVTLDAIVEDCFFLSEDDGWVVSYKSVWHWDGAIWTRVAECEPGDGFGSIAFNEPDSGWAGLYEARYGDPPLMFHYDGREWEEYGEIFNNDVWDIDFSGPNYGCAAGIGAAIYENGEWRKANAPRTYFWCVECVGPNDIWAGSDTGDIYHFTGF